MQQQNFLPPENTAVQNLLAIIKDPKGTQKRLDELNKYQSDINDKIDQLRESENAAKANLAEAEKAKADAEELKKYNEEVTLKLHAELKRKIDTYDQDYRDFLSQKGKDTKEIEETKQSLANRENSATSREVNVSSREEAVSKLETEVSELKKQYQDKLSKLKTIME